MAIKGLNASKENKHVWCETIVWQEPLINLLWASSATVPSLHAQSHSVLHSLTFCYHSLSFLQTSSKLTKLTIQMICNWFPAFPWNCALFVNAQVHDAVGNAKGSLHMINYKVFFFFWILWVRLTLTARRSSTNVVVQILFI